MNAIRSVRKSTKLREQVVAFSLSYDKADGGPRGLGAEHLRETLLQIARPLLRARAAIAYGGHLEPAKPPGSNFTLDLLNLIREEQQERSVSDATVQGLYNFQAWPFYLGLDREKEAEWINCCEIVRVTQRMAGFAEALPDRRVEGDAVRRFIHGAVCLSAMRRCMAIGCEQEIEGVPAKPREIPRVSARIVLGGKMNGFSGIMPGIFEEILIAREASDDCPIFLLGGFGGAAAQLAKALHSGDIDSNPCFSPTHYASQPEDAANPGFTDLLHRWKTVPLPVDARSPEEGFAELRARLTACAKHPADFLRNGLGDEDNRRLLTTVNPTEAVRLVLRGFSKDPRWVERM